MFGVLAEVSRDTLAVAIVAAVASIVTGIIGLVGVYISKKTSTQVTNGSTKPLIEYIIETHDKLSKVEATQARLEQVFQDRSKELENQIAATEQQIEKGINVREFVEDIVHSTRPGGRRWYDTQPDE